MLAVCVCSCMHVQSWPTTSEVYRTLSSLGECQKSNVTDLDILNSLNLQILDKPLQYFHILKFFWSSCCYIMKVIGVVLKYENCLYTSAFDDIAKEDATDDFPVQAPRTKKQYECILCQQVFTRSDNLLKHNRRKHANSG